MSQRAGAGSDAMELVMRVRLRDRRRAGEMLTALQELGGVRQAELVLRDELAEM